MKKIELNNNYMETETSFKKKKKIFSFKKDLKKLKEKKSYINKMGFWGNQEIIDLYTCRFLKKIFGFRWIFLCPFIKNR